MSGKSDSGASVLLQTGIDLDSTKTFKWAIKNFNLIFDNPNLYPEQKLEVKVKATSALPSMTLTLSLSHEESYRITFLNLNYLCRTDDCKPVPTYKAELNYINNSGLKKNPTGSWRLGSRQIHYPWNLYVRQSEGAILLEFTWEFYRNLCHGLGFQDERDTWNKRHEQSKKTELLQMLNSGRFSDVKVISGDGQVFQAHKLILKAGSEVFEAMFRHQMAESATGVITLDDMSARAVKFLLHFLYSSEILPISCDDQKGSDVSFEEVLYLASKYELKELTIHLEENIGKFCKEENAVNLLKLCKLHSLEKGKEVIFDLAQKKQWNVLMDLLFSQL